MREGKRFVSFSFGIQQMQQRGPPACLRMKSHAEKRNLGRGGFRVSFRTRCAAFGRMQRCNLLRLLYFDSWFDLFYGAG